MTYSCFVQFPSKRGVKHFKLSAVTQPLEPDKIDALSMMALDRILDAESMYSLETVMSSMTKFSYTSGFRFLHWVFQIPLVAIKLPSLP